jgi:hypothetical protein
MDLHAIPPELLAGALAVAVLIILSICLTLAIRKAMRRRTILARVRRAGEGELRAAQWLEELGYEISGAQVCVDYPVYVDEQLITVSLRADYLVKKDGARFVAEVKTGGAAPRIETAATRRQLLEYRVAFAVDGVLLVDAEAERVHVITFPRLSTR